MPSGADEPGRADGDGSVDLSVLGEVIGYQLRRAQLAVFDDFIRAFAEYDIRPSQFGVLTAIDRNPGSSQAAIAQSLGIKRSNFVKLVDEFEHRKLVVRREVAGDRRANALFLTPTGRATIERLRAIHVAHETRLSDAIGSVEDRRLFLEQLTRLSALRAGRDD